MQRIAFTIGVWLQGILLGALLFLALCELLSVSSGVRLFRYQNF